MGNGCCRCCYLVCSGRLCIIDFFSKNLIVNNASDKAENCKYNNYADRDYCNCSALFAWLFVRLCIFCVFRFIINRNTDFDFILFGCLLYRFRFPCFGFRNGIFYRFCLFAVCIVNIIKERTVILSRCFYLGIGLFCYLVLVKNIV